jgi:multisubunit Na+/H+ antiporter MnhF subunit
MKYIAIIVVALIILFICMAAAWVIYSPVQPDAVIQDNPTATVIVVGLGCISIAGILKGSSSGGLF